MDNRYPNLMGCLRREPMKPQCREQADNTIRHAFRCFDERMVLGRPVTVGDVESSSDLPHEPAVFCWAEVFSGNSHAIQFARPEDASQG